MKILVAVVALSFIICSDADTNMNAEAEEDDINVLEECFINAGVKEEELSDFNKNPVHVPDVPLKIRCAFKCILDYFSVTDPVSEEFLSKEIRDRISTLGSEEYKAIEGCVKDGKRENPCDTVFLTWVCLTDL